MNQNDVKNIKAVIKYKENIKNGPKMIKNGTYTFDELNSMTIKELKKLYTDYESKEKDVKIKQFKEVVDKIFQKWGEPENDMIILSCANCPERTTREADAFEEISFDGLELAYPIASEWEAGSYWDRKEMTKDEIDKWDKEFWTPYFKDVDELNKIASKLGIPTAEKYWREFNEGLNDMWYGVIGVLKDYKVVCFIIREDGMLLDEDDFEGIIAEF